MNSPFHHYFAEVRKKLDEEFKQSGSKGLFENEFYCPELYNLLLDQFYLLPVWSGIMLDNEMCSPVKTRISNNIVECWFNHLKNRIMTDSKNVNKQI